MRGSLPEGATTELVLSGGSEVVEEPQPKGSGGSGSRIDVALTLAASAWLPGDPRTRLPTQPPTGTLD